MSATHPPIPPNCECFVGEEFRTPHLDGQLGIDFPLDDPLPAWRPIIAAVARASWDDEYWRLRAEISKDSSKNGGYSVALSIKALDASKAERQWTAWGRGEWRP